MRSSLSPSHTAKQVRVRITRKSLIANPKHVQIFPSYLNYDRKIRNRIWFVERHVCHIRKIWCGNGIEKLATLLKCFDQKPYLMRITRRSKINFNYSVDGSRHNSWHTDQKKNVATDTHRKHCMSIGWHAQKQRRQTSYPNKIIWCRLLLVFFGVTRTTTTQWLEF